MTVLLDVAEFSKLFPVRAMGAAEAALLGRPRKAP
jgi:hypothetical protein